MVQDMTNFFHLMAFHLVTWKMVVMWIVVLVLLYLAVYKGFEPLLLIPIAFGALIANLPTQGVVNAPENGGPGGLYYYISKGITWEIFPPLIFLGVGALTDFGPLIANPRTLLLGAAAQLGIFVTFFVAYLLGFTAKQAASIGIIGGLMGRLQFLPATNLRRNCLRR